MVVDTVESYLSGIAGVLLKTEKKILMSTQSRQRHKRKIIQMRWMLTQSIHSSAIRIFHIRAEMP